MSIDNATVIPNPTVVILSSSVKTRLKDVAIISIIALLQDIVKYLQPQYAIHGVEKVEKEFEPKPGELFDPMIMLENPDKITVAPSETIDDEYEGD